MSRIRVGIIGLGVISRFYLAALDSAPSFTLTALCDPDVTRLADARRPADSGTDTAPVSVHRDHRELLAEARVDAVIVNVPNDLHYAVCRDAIEAGVAVCVEKPLTTRPAEAHRLTRLARRNGTPLFTSFHRRYNDEVRHLRARTVLAGKPVRQLTVRYHELIEEHAGRDRWYLDPARCGGGCLADNGPNAFDLVRYFLGDVRVVDAAVHRDARGVDRQARVVLRGHGGTEAVVDLDWSYPGERKEVEVRTADGAVDAADMLAGHHGFKESLWHEYVGVLGDFAHRLTTPGPDGPTGPDGPAVAELVAAGYAAECRPVRGDVR